MNKELLIELFNEWWEDYTRASAKEFSSQEDYFRETGEAFRIFTGGYNAALKRKA